MKKLVVLSIIALSFAGVTAQACVKDFSNNQLLGSTKTVYRAPSQSTSDAGGYVSQGSSKVLRRK